MTLKIEIEVSEENECTEAPWWVIVDPGQNMRLRIDEAAAQITGPFFSRAEAEAHLTATRYNYSKRAAVYCKSGWMSGQYRDGLRAAQRGLVKPQGVEPGKPFLWTYGCCGFPDGAAHADGCPKGPSKTRQRVEKIEDNLGMGKR